MRGLAFAVATLLLGGCTCGSTTPEPAPAPSPDVVPRAAVPLNLSIIMHSMHKSEMPPAVSATWADAGLQLMVSGFADRCEPEPELTVTQDQSILRVSVAPGEASSSCTGSHTWMFQLDGLEPDAWTIEVVDRRGAVFGTTTVTPETR